MRSRGNKVPYASAATDLPVRFPGWRRPILNHQTQQCTKPHRHNSKSPRKMESCRFIWGCDSENTGSWLYTS